MVISFYPRNFRGFFLYDPDHKSEMNLLIIFM